MDSLMHGFIYAWKVAIKITVHHFLFLNHNVHTWYYHNHCSYSYARYMESFMHEWSQCERYRNRSYRCHLHHIWRFGCSPRGRDIIISNLVHYNWVKTLRLCRFQGIYWLYFHRIKSSSYDILEALLPKLSEITRLTRSETGLKWTREGAITALTARADLPRHHPLALQASSTELKSLIQCDKNHQFMIHLTPAQI